MPLIYDLHTHSTASDGTTAPQELVQHAAHAGLDVLALTDHDTTEGLAEAAAEAAVLGLEFSPGVEISASWNGHVVHVIGLGIDPECQALQDGLAELRCFRNWRAEEIGRRLDKVGISGALEGAKAFSSGHLIGRCHFARFLVKNGHVEDERKVFQRFLTRGNPGYVPGQWAELEDAVSWICAAGGQAVIAHPARYPLTRTKLRRLLAEFIAAGGVGLEVVSGTHNRDEIFNMARHARELGLLASVGSDYHGPDNPWRKLGHLPPLPDGCVPIWHDWAVAHIASAATA
ncbi:FIG00031715: Predicted metal-dependent phosphoesterases (PHP family) [hydrothermal vent metagenome]|uniref:FIG00031715: Predicted metal-dependent phosphoesterases (PHP family) n=1 Tax=hydrothermal vent metagenome TaxID=652676 RepID=A0A3B1B1R7_9ZZZZ